MTKIKCNQLMQVTKANHEKERLSQNLSGLKAKVESLEESDMKRQKFERENHDLIAELEKLAVIADQYESLQDEAKSANDQVNSLTQRLAQNASR